jgi:hypothetical protein
MINFEAIIRHFWQRAVEDVERDHAAYDENALKVLGEENASNRRDTIRDWFQAYRVFRVRGIGAQRNEIVDAFLKWVDSRDRERNLDTAAALSDAHKELETLICNAYTRNSQNKAREFTSLTSKALWLCYPDKVPMFDGHAQRALWVLAKLEIGIATPPNGPDADDKYFQFVSVWKHFYGKYLAEISNLDTNGYPYRVRVFDRILWLIGKEQYTVSA